MVESNTVNLDTSTMTKLHEATAAPERKIVTVRRKFYYKTKKSHRGLLYASFLPILLVPNLHKEESDPDLQQPQFKTKKQSRKPTKRPKTKQRKEKGTQDRHPNNKEVAKKKALVQRKHQIQKERAAICRPLLPQFSMLIRVSKKEKNERKKEPPPETLIAQLQSLLSREASQSNNKNTSSNEIQKLWAQQTTTTTTTTKNRTANQSKRLTPEAKDQWKNT